MDNFFEEKLNEQQQLDEKIRNSRFYRKVKTDTKLPTSRTNKDGEKVEITLNQKEYYSQKDIAVFNLESYSKLIPDHDGYKLIVSTYFIRFWGPVFDYKPKEKGKIVRRSAGMIAYTYIVLKSYCWGKDYCWVSLQTLADNLSVTKNAVRGYLEKLEEEGFIIRFWRESEINGNIEEESMLIKVRQTIPFLTKEKLELLPEHLKKEHTDFLQYIKLESTKEFEDAYNYTQIYEELRNKTIEVKVPEIGRKKEQIYNTLTSKDISTWNMMKERLKHYVSESSINHWFGDSFTIIKDRELILYVSSEFERDYIDKEYKFIIFNVTRDLLIPVDKISVETYDK